MQRGRILVPPPGIKPTPLQWKYRAPNHWTTKEVPQSIFKIYRYCKVEVKNLEKDTNTNWKKASKFYQYQTKQTLVQNNHY